jgi:hypothetical protein
VLAELRPRLQLSAAGQLIDPSAQEFLDRHMLLFKGWLSYETPLPYSFDARLVDFDKRGIGVVWLVGADSAEISSPGKSIPSKAGIYILPRALTESDAITVSARVYASGSPIIRRVMVSGICNSLAAATRP